MELGRPPAALVRKWITIPSIYSFEGLIDQIAIDDAALRPQNIAELYQVRESSSTPALQW